MKCYALGLLKNSSMKIDWSACGKISLGFIGVDLNEKVLSSQKELTELCYALELGESEFGEIMGCYCASIKHVEGCCLVSCDKALKKSELYILSLWMLHSSMTLEQLANNIANYISEIPANISKQHIEQIEHLRKIEELEEVLGMTLNSLKEAQEAVIARGGNMEELLGKTQQLTETSFKFKNRTKEMNSCWGKCNIF